MTKKTFRKDTPAFRERRKKALRKAFGCSCGKKASSEKDGFVSEGICWEGEGNPYKTHSTKATPNEGSWGVRREGGGRGKLVIRDPSFM